MKILISRTSCLHHKILKVICMSYHRRSTLAWNKEYVSLRSVGFELSEFIDQIFLTGHAFQIRPFAALIVAGS